MVAILVSENTDAHATLTCCSQVASRCYSLTHRNMSPVNWVCCTAPGQTAFDFCGSTKHMIFRETASMFPKWC